MMGGYGFNPTGANGISALPQPPSLWDRYTQNAQNLRPLNSLLGQAGNQLEQRSINLLHGDGFRTDAQVYPPLPPPPVSRPTPWPSVPGAVTASGTQQIQPQPQTASPQKPGAGQGGVRGYAHALVDNLGLTSVAHQVAHPIQAASEMQQQTATDPHPFQTVLRRATIDDPMLGISTLRGLAGAAKNSLTEIGQAFNDLGITPYGYQTPQYGPNYASAGVHAVRAIPILGAGLEKGQEYASQNGMGDPGNSYLQNVGKVWSSPKAMGTLTGMALQSAPVAEARLKAGGWDGPLVSTANAVSNPMKALRAFYSAPDLLKSNLTTGDIVARLRNLDIPYQATRRDFITKQVNQNIDMLNEGKTAPPVDVDGDAIVHGHHRTIAGYIHGTPPAVRQITPGKVLFTPRPFNTLYGR